MLASLAQNSRRTAAHWGPFARCARVLSAHLNVGAKMRRCNEVADSVLHERRENRGRFRNHSISSPFCSVFRNFG